MFSGYIDRIKEISVSRPDIIGTRHNLELKYETATYKIDEWGQTVADRSCIEIVRARVKPMEDPYIEKGAELDRSRHYIEGHILNWKKGMKIIGESIEGVYLDSEGWKPCLFNKIEIIRPNYIERMVLARSIGSKITGYLKFNDQI